MHFLCASDEVHHVPLIFRKKLDRDELEQKVTALTLRLVANANSISERIEKQTEKYRCQYEAILTLVGDISYRLR